MSGVSLCLHFLSIFCMRIPPPPCILSSSSLLYSITTRLIGKARQLCRTSLRYVPHPVQNLTKLRAPPVQNLTTIRAPSCAEPHYDTCPILCRTSLSYVPHLCRTSLRYATFPILLSIIILYVHTDSNISAAVYLEVVLIFTFCLFSCLSSAYLETTRL